MNIYQYCANLKQVVWNVAAGLLLVSLLSACATVRQDVQTEQQALIAERLDAYILDEGDIRHDIEDENVAKLWQESEVHRQQGDLDNAMERLQQALVITPRDAVLWSRAAEFALEQNSSLRAENYAAKSNFLTALGNRPLRYRNWLIIQRSRESRGDLLGARDAEIESTKLNRGN